MVRGSEVTPWDVGLRSPRGTWVYEVTPVGRGYMRSPPWNVGI